MILNNIIIDAYLYTKFGREYCIRVYEMLLNWSVRVREISIEECFEEIYEAVCCNEQKRMVHTIHLSVELISKYIPVSCCIDKTIVKAILLLENGYDFSIIYGVFKAGKVLKGHAWIEMQDGEVLDRELAYISCKKVICKEMKSALL